MPAPAAGTLKLARTRERRHRTARVRTSTGGCARRIPGTTPRDGSSSLPTSTSRGRSPTCLFALPEHHPGGLGPCWVGDGGGVGVLEPVGELLELIGEQVPVAVQRHRRRRVAELGLDPLTLAPWAMSGLAQVAKVVALRTRRSLLPQIIGRAKREHPHEVPSVVAVAASYWPAVRGRDEWPTTDGRDYLRASPGAIGLAKLSAASLPGTDWE